MYTYLRVGKEGQTLQNKPLSRLFSKSWFRRRNHSPYIYLFLYLLHYHVLHLFFYRCDCQVIFLVTHQIRYTAVLSKGLPLYRESSIIIMSKTPINSFNLTQIFMCLFNCLKHYMVVKGQRYAKRPQKIQFTGDKRKRNLFIFQLIISKTSQTMCRKRHIGPSLNKGTILTEGDFTLNHARLLF